MSDIFETRWLVLNLGIYVSRDKCKRRKENLLQQCLMIVAYFWGNMSSGHVATESDNVICYIRYLTYSYNGTAVIWWSGNNSLSHTITEIINYTTYKIRGHPPLVSYIQTTRMLIYATEIHSCSFMGQLLRFCHNANTDIYPNHTNLCLICTTLHDWPIISWKYIVNCM